MHNWFMKFPRVNRGFRLSGWLGWRHANSNSFIELADCGVGGRGLQDSRINTILLYILYFLGGWRGRRRGGAGGSGGPGE